MKQKQTETAAVRLTVPQNQTIDDHDKLNLNLLMELMKTETGKSCAETRS